MEYLEQMKNDDASDWLDVALDCRKVNVAELELIKGELTESYEIYDQLIESYNVAVTASEFDNSKALVIEYYEKPPADLKKLIQTRRNSHGLTDCPFCGYPFVPDTLDHFIPKNSWPEYSIFDNNLVPQCRGCAPTKSEKYYCDTINKALFIHPIYSDLLSRIKFVINVDYNRLMTKPAFSIRLVKIGDVDVESLTRIRTHLSELKVKSRILLFCDREYRGWKNKLTKKRFDIRAALSQRLEEVTAGAQGKDWRTSLYSGILNNEALIQFLNSIGTTERVQEQEEIEEEIDF